MALKVVGSGGSFDFHWDPLDQWKTMCQWNSQLDQAQMDAAEMLRGESFQRRYAALESALQAGSVDATTYLLEKKIVRMNELSEEQQFECWKGVRSTEMRALLEKEGFKISSPETLLRHLKVRVSTEVLESFIKVGVEEGLEAIYDEIKGYDTCSVALIRSYVTAIRFCKGEVPIESIDEKAFEVIRQRANLNAFGDKKLTQVWVLTCKFNHFDEKEGSFFVRFVDLFFAKQQRTEIKFLGFIIALDAVTDIPRYLLEKGKIVAEEFTPEQHSQCWRQYNHLTTAPVLKQYRFNVDAEMIVNDKPTYPIQIVVQMAVEEDVRLSRVTDLLESGATAGVQEALVYCRDHKLNSIVELIEQHLAAQKFLQQFDALMTTQIPRVASVLTAVKRVLVSGTIKQIVLDTRYDLGPDFYAVDLMPLIPALENSGLYITVTHIYDGYGTYRPSELTGRFSTTAGCKIKVSFHGRRLE